MSGSETYRRTKVVLVHPRDTDGERVARSLINLGCRVDYVWPPNNDLPADTNLVFFLLDQRTRRWMLSLIGRERFGVIAILEQEPATAEMLLEDSNPHAVVVKPIRPLDVLTSMVVARSISQYNRRVASKIKKLEETLRSVRKVETAKSILMKSKNLNECEAYEYLRKTAMNRRVPIGNIASAIIEASNLLVGDEFVERH